ncbi:sigma-54-dependent Fis family transcriptional regulator [Pseudomonas laurentiana]|uniref:AAA domain-containing protein n=1 Tax=Pseudomonas laurentiana TaxID=2364649 RepID=A0A6I5RR47_9PSED|nr:sigma 54-interacting transcriptional regulator [Pseudomonas laurentiana]NES10116.1 AAA domain-containing protein [Pseudomonas laurentiana]GGU83538.1 sigma-54-dependent Fis family transcriptional regulator [Pseudomonas laurentiana]
MFTQVAQPLVYAEAVLARYASLSRMADEGALLAEFVRATAELSGCELSQVYLLDATHTSLGLSAEWLDGVLQPREAAELPADYNGEQLLQFALCQNREVSISDLSSDIHDISFLPRQATLWRSLLCVPLSNRDQAVAGLILCASRVSVDLQGFAGSLRALGGFVLDQLHLLQRVLRSTCEASPRVEPVVCSGAYGLIGRSTAMRHTYQLISKVLHTPYTVLLQGETGTGKEVVARAIHDYGPRSSKAFIAHNCAALPESLLESELFGYRKGAFSGADTDRAGLFAAADGGTLLLDEVGDMPLALQAKLLRVLQEGEIRPLGANQAQRIDVRIIAATHRDLSARVSEGTFREDLYYRLAQFPITLPALRQREGDLRELALHFADKACAILQREPLRWSDAAFEHLGAYSFPGNVRELKGLIERAVLLCEGGELRSEHFTLNLDTLPQAPTRSLRERLDQVERRLLLDCLHKHGGNQTLVARELGLPRRTLLYRLGRLSIPLGGSDS